MNVVDFFSFLPYGKYAFYIWFSYLFWLITTLVIINNTIRIRKRIHKGLRIKYARDLNR